MNYPGTNIEIETGDWLVSSESGPDYGEVISIEDNDGRPVVTVAWAGSLTRIAYSVPALAGVEVYPDRGAARADYLSRKRQPGEGW